MSQNSIVIGQMSNTTVEKRGVYCDLQSLSSVVYNYGYYFMLLDKIMLLVKNICISFLIVRKMCHENISKQLTIKRYSQDKICITFLCLLANKILRP